MRVDPRVRAEPDPDTRRDRLREPLALRVGGVGVLAQRLGRPAVLPSHLVDVVPVVDVGDEVAATIDHELDALVVDQGPVLDRADPGAHGPLDALRAVGVRRDERAVLGRGLDRDPELFLRELGGAGVRPARHHRAGRDHLDEVGVEVEDLAHPGAYLVGRARDAEAQVPRDRVVDVRREAGDVAAALRTREVGAGAGHPRALHPARLDPVAQRNVDERSERADVTNGGEPGPQRVAGVAHAVDRLLRPAAHHEGRVVRAGLALGEPDEVGVEVDQPREHGEVREVEHALPHGVLGVVPRTDLRDPVAVERDEPVRVHAAVIDVDEPAGPDRGDAGRGHGAHRTRGAGGEPDHGSATGAGAIGPARRCGRSGGRDRPCAGGPRRRRPR